MTDIEKWTPLATFAVAYACAVLGSIGLVIKLAGDGGPAVTFGRIVACFLYSGPLSVAFVMLVWESPIIDEKPILGIALAWLTGLGIIKGAAIAQTVRGYLKLEVPPNAPRPKPPSDSEP